MDSGDEIEYLDEDAEIVQQCVQPPVISTIKIDEKPPLLVERPLEKRKKRKKEPSEDDSDYDPSKRKRTGFRKSTRIRMSPVKVTAKTPTRTIRTQITQNVQSSSQSPQHVKNKRLTAQNAQNKSQNILNSSVLNKSKGNVHNKSGSTKNVLNRSQSTKIALNKIQNSINDLNKSQGANIEPNKNQNPQNVQVNEAVNRKNMRIHIPDYSDPLCMPVRALPCVSSDVQRLKNWNNACLEHFKQCDTTFKPEMGQTISSSRTIVLRNVVHKDTGRTETAVWSKNCVESKEGGKKSEIFQGILPKYREKKVLDPYNMLTGKKSKVRHYNEVLLTKEDNRDVLVVYNPKDSLSAVYKLVQNEDRVDIDKDDDEPKRLMREVACCKVCVMCYQMSWRGTKQSASKNTIRCPICERNMVSVYNLLTHVKGHSAEDIRKYKGDISALLAGVLQYHYRCRVCQKTCPNIKTLRQHVMRHKGSIPFRCEIGNHMTT